MRDRSGDVEEQRATASRFAEVEVLNRVPLFEGNNGQLQLPAIGRDSTHTPAEGKYCNQSIIMTRKRTISSKK